MYFILDGNNSIIPCDLKKWAHMFETSDRKVNFTKLNGYDISTVFLGLDHNYFGGPPLVFETMIFNRANDGVYQTRCSTWDEAEQMHANAIEWVKNGCKDE